MYSSENCKEYFSTYKTGRDHWQAKYQSEKRDTQPKEPQEGVPHQHWAISSWCYIHKNKPIPVSFLPLIASLSLNDISGFTGEVALNESM